MIIPYRTQQAFKRLGVALLVIIVLLTAARLCWLLWVSRYVVYTQDGVRLDFSLPAKITNGQLATPPAAKDPVSIYYNEGDNQVETGTELKQLVGYYVEPELLMDDVLAVRDHIQSLPAGTAVLVDLKNIYGRTYYSSTVIEHRSSDVNITAMDEFLQVLDRSGMYTIARVPALRDQLYGLNNVSHGLHHSSRYYLWQDDERCYWLDPTSEGTVSYLARIATELRSLGFDEVVFDDFYVPTGDDIYFSGNRAQVLSEVAQTLVTSCATESFAVSFVASSEFTPPEGRSRIYMKDVEPSQAAAKAESIGVADTAINLAFITPMYDTRFDVYGVLRPLSSAY